MKAILLIGVVSLIQISCGAASSSHHADEEVSTNSEPVENSGRKISGDFVLSGVENEYKVKGPQPSQRPSLSFDDAGNFKRQDRLRVEEGAYLIGPRNQLVLYIDKVNGDLLASAHVEKFLIVAQSEGSITLQNSPSETVTWKRK